MLTQLELSGRPPDYDIGKQWSTMADTVCVCTGKLSLTLFEAMINQRNRKNLYKTIPSVHNIFGVYDIAALSSLISRAYSRINLRGFFLSDQKSRLKYSYLKKYAVMSSFLQKFKLHSRPARAIFFPRSSCDPSPLPSPRKNTKESYKSDKSTCTGT